MTRKRSRRAKGAAAIGSGLSGQSHAGDEAAATDALRNGLRGMRKAAGRREAQSFAQKKGYLVEHLEAAKLNADLARKGLRARAEVTAETGSPHSPADIVIRESGRAVKKIQSKTSRSTPTLVREFSKAKYRRMERLAPIDKVESVKEVSKRLAARSKLRGDGRAADLRDTSRRVTGELRHGTARSGGTSSSDAEAAAKSPGRYSAGVELRQIGREAGHAALGGAVTGAVLGSAMSAVSEGIRYWRGEVTLGKAARTVAIDTARGAAAGAGVGTAGALVRSAAAHAGLDALARSNVATGVAAGLIEATSVIIAYCRGRISGEKAGELLGQAACSTVSSIYAGAVAGSLLGPPGAVVGAMAGYFVSSFAFQACLTARREANRELKEAERLEALADEAILALEAARTELEKRVHDAVQTMEVTFGGFLERIELGLRSGNPEDVVVGLSMVSAFVGNSLQIATFEEFDFLMVETDDPVSF